VAASVAACGGNPNRPPTDPPQISCPESISVVSADGQPVSVPFPTPTVAGGQNPVSTTCNPASPATAAVGSTTVTCTATDARQRTASCTFGITVVPPPRLVATRFLAFGDSFTYGENGDALGHWRLEVQVANPFPELLERMLVERYTSQTISMTNDGKPGESLALVFPGNVGTAPPRFSRDLSSGRYDAALVLEGVNDFFNRDSRDIPPAIAALRSMVRDARSRNIRIVLATLPPMNPAGRRATSKWQLVPQFNDQLKTMAAAEQVPVADIYAAFNGDFSLLNDDGLHPNDRGYERIAETFFATIKSSLEAPPPATTSLRMSGAPGAAPLLRPRR